MLLSVTNTPTMLENTSGPAVPSGVNKAPVMSGGRLRAIISKKNYKLCISWKFDLYYILL